MTMPVSGLYRGDVVHKRLRPITHGLKYRVFSLLLDVSELAQISDGLKLFSYNKFNLLSLYDRDYGNGEELKSYLRDIAEESGHGDQVKRFFVLCYPRVFGYVFNPLTTYYGVDANGDVRLILYEVSNTFGGRQTYVLPAEPDEQGMVMQGCEKRLYVSPFNSERGSYTFHVTPPSEQLTIGILLRDEAGPLLRAHFHGHRQPLTDRSILDAVTRTGWLSVKIIVGIHYEALKLWFKGMRIKPRPATVVKHRITYMSRPIEK